MVGRGEWLHVHPRMPHLFCMSRLVLSLVFSVPRLLCSSASSKGFSSTYMASPSCGRGNKALKDECFVAMVTCPSVDIAKQLSRGLVEKKLVACVNVVPLVTSIYAWEGKIEEDEESLMIIKTCQVQLDEVIGYVEKNHPYDVPEVISMKIEHGSEPYLDWIKKVTAKS